jgi:hypothetical protein
MVATKSQGIHPSELSRPRRATDAAPAAGGAAPGSSIARTGVVFVHGIGSQQPAETLLQWSAPIIEVLTAWHRQFPHGPDDPDPRDPVRRATIDFSSTLPTISLRVPSATTPDGVVHPESEWLLTEAWWASKVEPPGLNTITNWLGPSGGAAQVVDGILGNRTEGWLLTVSRAAVVPFVSVLSGIILTLYGLLRGVTAIIPIQSVKDAAILHTFDDFLTGWFGDVRILLFDPAQSANIRGGLAEAITRLRGAGCMQVVVVAHSGGVMVSYLALTDPALDPKALNIDKFVTFGEGWNLALRLTPADVGMADRLRRDITHLHPGLRWRDFWGSHDPAPAGSLALGEIHPPISDAGRQRVRSFRVWNRRSLLEDHGGYFDNDEEFVVPLMREIDVPGGWGEASRFYPPDDPARATVVPEESADDPRAMADARVVRHRQRVATVAMWRQVALAVPVATIALALQSRPERLITIGTEVTSVIPRIPIVADVIDFVRAFCIETLPEITFELPFRTVEKHAIADFMTLFGTGVLQAVVLIAALQLTFAPIQAYRAWPPGAPMRRVMFAVESIVIVSLALAVARVYFIPATDPSILLGAGWVAWAPGLFVTALAGLLTIGTSELVKTVKAPALSSAFGVASSIFFTFAMAAAVVAIFTIPQLEVAEVAYVVIWIGAFLILSAGRNRWSLWDRAERQIAYGLVGAVKVNRYPAIISSIGFMIIGLVLAAWVITASSPWIVIGVSLGVVLIVLGMAWGAKAWRQYGDPVVAPGSVESARGSV